MQTIALFDLDGVIVDTEGQYTLFWEKVGKRDFPETEDFAARIKGHTLKQIVGEYYPNDAEKRQQVIEELWQFEREMDFPYIKGAVTFQVSPRIAGAVRPHIYRRGRAALKARSRLLH